MLQTSLLPMKSLNKTETPIFLSVVCCLFPAGGGGGGGQSFGRLFYYTAAGISVAWRR